jgi:uncharacterized protein YuzB (UPF0349 family)
MARVTPISDVTASTWLTGARRGAAQVDHRCTREYTVHWCMARVTPISDVTASTWVAGAWRGVGQLDHRCTREYMATGAWRCAGQLDHRCNREYMAHWCTEGCCSTRSPMYSRVHGSLVHAGVTASSITDVLASTWLTGARRGAAQVDHRCTREYTVHWCMARVTPISDVTASTWVAGAWRGVGQLDHRCTREYMATGAWRCAGQLDHRCNREYMAHWCTEGCCSTRSPMYSRVHGSLVHAGVTASSITDVLASTWLTGARRGAAQVDHRCTREYMAHWCTKGCCSTRPSM